ncbi:MAG TPA: hypothetical protein GXX36_14105 [Clostridiaceae bacterium]|nr:hypothetical protein [Clostridiaceae bacterium]
MDDNKNKYEKLEYITKGICAANKINEMYNSRIQTRDGSSIMPDRLDMLCEMLNIIAQYSPAPQSRLLGNAADKSAKYSEAYRNIKLQINNVRSNGMNIDTVISTLKYIRPLLRGQQLHTIDKIIRVYDIIKS